MDVNLFLKLLLFIQEMSPVEAFLLALIIIPRMAKAGAWGYNRIKKKRDLKEIHVHSDCKNFPSMKLLVISAINKAAEIQWIKHNETTEDQMKEADELYLDALDILKTNYLTLYRYKKGSSINGLLNEIQVKYYISILQNSEKIFKALIRRFMKKNHFLQKSEQEFRLYVSERTEDLQKALTNFLDQEYNSNVFLVSREELYESNMKCMPEIEKKIESFFYRIRTITSEKVEKIEELKSQIPEFYEE